MRWLVPFVGFKATRGGNSSLTASVSEKRKRMNIQHGTSSALSHVTLSRGCVTDAYE